MPKIIFATDFSPVAQNACLYVAELASNISADFELLHAYVIPFAYTDSPVPLLNIDEIQDIAETSMQAELARLKVLFPELNMTYKILPGEIINCLLEIIEKEPPVLVALGTSGQNAGSFLWGSVAIKALRTLPVPVLAVSADSIWKPVKKICFAADYSQLSDSTPIAEVGQWTRLLNAQLFVVHVAQDDGHYEAPQFLVQQLAYLNPVYHTLFSENLVDGVHGFLKDNQIDWLVVIPKKYGFFENLFHKSRTKVLTQGSNVPVLSFHQD